MNNIDFIMPTSARSIAMELDREHSGQSTEVPIEIILKKRPDGFLLDEAGVSLWERSGENYDVVRQAMLAAADAQWSLGLLTNRIVDCVCASYAFFPELLKLVDPGRLADDIIRLAAQRPLESLATLLAAAQIDPTLERICNLLIGGRNAIEAAEYSRLVREWIDRRPPAYLVGRLLNALSSGGVDRAVTADLGLLARALPSRTSNSVRILGEAGTTIFPPVTTADGAAPQRGDARRGQILVRARKVVDLNTRTRNVRSALDSAELANRFQKLRSMLQPLREAQLENVTPPDKSPRRIISSIVAWPEYAARTHGKRLRAIYLKTQYGRINSTTGSIEGELHHPGEALCYGPYLSLSAGRYRIALFGRTAEPTTIGLTIRSHQPEARTFAQFSVQTRPTAECYAMIETIIVLPNAADLLEFVVIVEQRRGYICIESLLIEEIDG